MTCPQPSLLVYDAETGTIAVTCNRCAYWRELPLTTVRGMPAHTLVDAMFSGFAHNHGPDVVRT